jgi:stage V sporulation protein R
MELIDQKTKRIMEGCKKRAHEAGLRFGDETLEYIVTNRDLINLTPKYMIPTLYDYWVHDLEVLKEKGRYELYPSNPYETVINTRPAISFYNDNNPDWMNVMIFYHVLAHIDFFRNNVCYRNTWDFDFTGQALADKRLIAKLRSEKGRWVDYAIEFSRGIDNLVGYHAELARDEAGERGPTMLDYYFDVYLQDVKKVSTSEYIKELERYNRLGREHGDTSEQLFFAEVRAKNPEFDSLFDRYRTKRTAKPVDLLQYLIANSDHLKKDENAWIQSVMEVVRKTSLFFQPQIRTKIMNEGWASYWHERLFLADDRIRGHEVDFAKAHAGVASLPRVGLNPYALGMRLFEYIQDLGDKGRRSFAYQRIADTREREAFDSGAGEGERLIFDVRRRLSDSLFIDAFVDQDFVNRYKLFVAGRRLNRERMSWEYYVKSRDAGAYRAMLRGGLYHPPYIRIDESGGTGNTLRLIHRFEGKPLVNEYIHNTMLGIEYLWGAPVELETSEVVSVSSGGRSYTGTMPPPERPGEEPKITWRRVRYKMRNRKLSKKEL